ncbi:2,3-bisphosphoglycerate-independent phosphoglycerate mutase [Pseudidiomarina sediminum]|uniref:2,3-bisphosphoglycerate-independent phosphoglycerate mutase n=1 Tax=Pseudidiomarina sediminum TaxID=431675 RepID=A0A432ZA65_9GAMM|nr:2,3-bisphosphoglycerate-independent phosphoglycerate mutase [Pseudidiomarina sediminum]MBY6064051.1 2,3-bisphosphoglycerate-independent phosphoglycerate mutase [Pseudidiomarina sediminum]RUO74847.1 2,3-bisphosphoglycerate-independent phosphoglycerate mutase [Pseudidiomarina sediminum]
MAKPHTPLALLILDGWGHREAADDNAIAAAHTPTMDALWQQCPHTLVDGSGMAVGLPHGQMGNSEVGHVNLGAGRVVYQDFTRISKAIADGEFYQNPTLTRAVDAAVQHEGAVHIMGLLSPGGVHSHEDHLLAMVELAAQRGAKRVYVHGFLDGRDTPPRSAKPSLERFEQLFSRLGVGRFASLCGRYYAMDRDQRWDRVEQAWQLLVDGVAPFHAESASDGLAMAYERDESDEFVQPTRIADAAPMQDGDAVIFMNFRADRARQLSHAFISDGFAGFAAQRRPQLAAFVSLTEYAKDIHSDVAFPAVALHNVLGEWLAKQGYTQLRISETEKYAHVTFFFSGGREQEFDGETRVLIPSPQVATYDLQPEMSSEALTDALVEAIESGKHDVIVCNYPNGDMVGHTGNFAAAVKAVEAVDRSIARVIDALQRVNGECLITADHGNAEQMQDHTTGQCHTAHTSELVPFIYVGRDATPRDGGTLSDVAPTMLHLLGLEQPAEMTGSPIVTLK